MTESSNNLQAVIHINWQVVGFHLTFHMLLNQNYAKLGLFETEIEWFANFWHHISTKLLLKCYSGLTPALLPEVDAATCFHCSYVHTGCAALRLILKNFASVIKANITAPPSLGVDITREERWVLASRGSYRHI